MRLAYYSTITAVKKRRDSVVDAVLVRGSVRDAESSVTTESQVDLVLAKGDVRDATSTAIPVPNISSTVDLSLVMGDMRDATSTATPVPNISSTVDPALAMGDVRDATSIAYKIQTVDSAVALGDVRDPTSTVTTPPVEHTPSAVSQSSTWSSLTATISNMADTNYATGGFTNTNNPSWIKLDLGSNKTVGKVRTAGGNLSGWGPVKDFLNGRVLQYSTNDADWTTAVTISGATDSGTYYSEQTFTGVSARYWRIASTGNDYTGTTEFRVYSS